MAVTSTPVSFANLVSKEMDSGIARLTTGLTSPILTQIIVHR